MADGVDEGVVAGAGLGQQSGQGGDERSHSRDVAHHALEGDQGVGGPAQEPQRHVGNGGLGDADLSTLGLGLLCG